jgi:hypothetical protein
LWVLVMHFNHNRVAATYQYLKRLC